MSQQAPVCALCSSHSKHPGSTGILPAFADTDRREGKAVSPDRCLSDARRLEGSALPARGFCDTFAGRGAFRTL